MKTTRCRAALVGAALLIATGAGGHAVASAPSGGLSLSSPAIQAKTAVPTRFTCDGDGLSPSLMIQGVPQAAQSLVIEIQDPDAPNGLFTHWGLYNLAPDTAFLAAGASRHGLPGPAASVTNGYDKTGYGAICPPAGQRHRYRFDLYALDTRLTDHPKTAAALEADRRGRVIAHSRFTATYIRP